MLLLNIHVLIQTLALGTTAFPYFSNFKFDKKLIYGGDGLDYDYVTLANDVKKNLPDTFTVCLSIHSKFRPGLNDFAILDMYKQDGSHWFHLNPGDIKRRTSETVEIFYENPLTKKRGTDFFSGYFPIVPHSWYHFCVGLDTLSGLLRIVVNGVEVVNEEKNYFRNSADVKPKSLAEKLLVFKEHHIGVYLNNRGMFTNMNIFGSMMSVDAMIQRTSGGESCFDPGDYLRYVWFKKVLVNQSSIFAFSWEDMKWNVTGNVLAGTTDSVEVCHK